MADPRLPIEIDYSDAFPALTEADAANANWEPPPHVYYGKRMANGKSEKEPQYVYQEFPRMLYKPKPDGMLRAKVVNDAAAKNLLLNDGWGLGPSDFGLETCPGRPDVIAAAAAVADRSVVKPVPMEDIEAAIPEMRVPMAAKTKAVVVKRKRGRPAKVRAPKVEAAPEPEAQAA